MAEQISIVDAGAFRALLRELDSAADRIAKIDGRQKVLEEVTAAARVRSGPITLGATPTGTPAPAYTGTTEAMGALVSGVGAHCTAAVQSLQAVVRDMRTLVDGLGSIDAAGARGIESVG